MIWQWKVGWLSRKPLAEAAQETLMCIFHLLAFTALNGHNLYVVSSWLKEFWGRNNLCFLESCTSCSLALIIFLSFFTSALVWVEGQTPPSIKHNFSAYFIIFSPHPLSPAHSMIVTFALINPLSLSDILWLWFAWQRLVYPLKSS